MRPGVVNYHNKTNIMKIRESCLIGVLQRKKQNAADLNFGACFVFPYLLFFTLSYLHGNKTFTANW